MLPHGVAIRIGITLLLSVVQTSCSYTIVPKIVPTRILHSSRQLLSEASEQSIRSDTCLFGRKVKRGSLASVIKLEDEDDDDFSSSGATTATKSRSMRRQRYVNKEKGSKKTSASSSSATSPSGSSVSPDLAAWLEQNGGATTTSSVEDDGDEEQEELGRSRRGGKDSKKKQQQQPSTRKIEETKRSEQVQVLVKQIQDVLTSEEAKKDITSVMFEPLQSLFQLSSSNLRQLTAAPSTTYNYRLAWVGSDDAMCHIGTGLHKVPLARMEEVFLSIGTRGQVLLQEVIRILGPFPNVKNTLQGTTSTVKKRTDTDTAGAVGGDVQDWKITWTSMIDGAGKELIAPGSDEQVQLHVCFSDPSILVAVMPDLKDDGTTRTTAASTSFTDPLQENGKNILLFMKEDDIDKKLEKLRVA